MRHSFNYGGNMRKLYKCDECDEEFYIFVEDEEQEFCPTCNSGNIRVIE